MEVEGEWRISVDFRRSDAGMVEFVAVSLGIGLEFERTRRRRAGFGRSFFTDEGSR